MENDKLNQIWDSQNIDLPIGGPEDIVQKAKKQRKGQFLTILILVITVLVLLAFTFHYSGNRWNDFTLGLTLMISSLTFRIVLELITLLQKESQLVSLDIKSFRTYLKRHYRLRLGINYIISPICFAIYVIGFLMLLPFFKQAFSEGFYLYILISGAISLLAVLVIIIKGVLKEIRLLRQLNEK